LPQLWTAAPVSCRSCAAAAVSCHRLLVARW